MTTGLGLWFCQPACRQANAQGGVIFTGKEDNGNVIGISDYKKLRYKIQDGERIGRGRGRRKKI